MERVEKVIADFCDRERKEAENAVATEKDQVRINPDCYIANEIKYQTALLHGLKNYASVTEAPRPEETINDLEIKHEENTQVIDFLFKAFSGFTLFCAGAYLAAKVLKKEER